MTILPDEPSVGALVREHLLDDEDIDFALEDGNQNQIYRNRHRIEDAIFVSLAGPYAQRRHDRSSKWRRGKDFKEARCLVYCLHQHCRLARERVISSFWRYTNDRVDEFLERQWSAIETLAHRLIREEKVSKDEASRAAIEMAVVEMSDDLAESPRLAAMFKRIEDDLRS